MTDRLSAARPTIVEPLANTPDRSHIEVMATTVKRKRTRKSDTTAVERTVVYRGIKIAPIEGRRSPLSKMLRDELRSRTEQSRGATAQA